MVKIQHELTQAIYQQLQSSNLISTAIQRNPDGQNLYVACNKDTPDFFWMREYTFNESKGLYVEISLLSRNQSAGIDLKILASLAEFHKEHGNHINRTDSTGCPVSSNGVDYSIYQQRGAFTDTDCGDIDPRVFLRQLERIPTDYDAADVHFTLMGLTPIIPPPKIVH